MDASENSQANAGHGPRRGNASRNVGVPPRRHEFCARPHAAIARRLSTSSDRRTAGACGGTTRLRAGSFSTAAAIALALALASAMPVGNSARASQMLLRIAPVADQAEALTFVVS